MSFIIKLKKHKKIFSFACKITNFFSFNLFKGKHNNTIKCYCSILRKTKVKIIGKNNEIIIDNFSKLRKCKIHINGNNNRVYIGNNCDFNNVTFFIENDKNVINIGSYSTIQNNVEIAAIESTTISLGNDCMLSSSIDIRSGDSHSIINSFGDRINFSSSIFIGNHVWIGEKVTCLKGTKIGNNCIVGAGSIVNKSFEKDNIVIAGNPAKEVKADINWKRERL